MIISQPQKLVVPLTRKESTYYLHKIYKLLKDEDVEFNLALFRSFIDEYGDRRVICGEAGGGEISIDPRSVAIKDACIHEPLHILYPSWSERRVVRMTDKVAGGLSLRQWRTLVCRFVARLT